jgi:voltage-gated potassium channel
VKYAHWLGIAGVAQHERGEAVQWARRLEWPMLGVALWIVVQWYLEATQAITPEFSRIADWLVWLAFLIETSVLTSQVSDKRAYLQSNWLNVLIIVGGFPAFWEFAPLVGLMRSFRLILIVALLVRMSKSARKLLSQHRLGTTLIVALITMVVSGLLMSRIDPSIGTAWDGMWWAWVTMATVGYGDVVPHSGAGRVFASLVMVFGVVLLSLLTANLAAFFIGNDVEKLESGESEQNVMLKDITARLERIEKQLQDQQKREP